MRPPRRKPKVELPFIQLLPNLMTVTAIVAGLSSIRFAFEGEFQLAAMLILLAGVLDGIDGKLARLLKSESALGAELDSLADFLNFGVAPGILIYVWAFQDMRSAGWIAAILYSLCCVMRLARFNIGMKARSEEGAPAYFVGVPAPAGAFLVMLPIFVAFAWPAVPVAPGPLVAVYMLCVGLLMISRLRTYKFTSVTVYREYVPLAFLGFVCVVGALLTFPWATLVLLDLGYALGLIWGWRASRANRPRAAQD